MLDGIVQEIDIETGEVLFEWHSLDHVVSLPCLSRTSSYYDHLHINSIDPFHDGYMIISSRRTSTVFKIDRKTGEVVWRLGGEKSDFEMGPGVRSSTSTTPAATPTAPSPSSTMAARHGEQSRGIEVIGIDEDAMKATLVREYTHPNDLLSPLQGNVQVLPNGNVFVGWGSSP